MFFQIASFVINRIPMLERFQKLDFFQNVLPFLKAKKEHCLYNKTLFDQSSTSVDCLPVKDIFLMATTSFVTTLRAYKINLSLDTWLD